jgi:hypothetical protein
VVICLVRNFLSSFVSSVGSIEYFNDMMWTLYHYIEFGAGFTYIVFGGDVKSAVLFQEIRLVGANVLFSSLVPA